ncbi:PepSY domain-containing protein [Methylovulum miyakonense]|uniref:PepSY domain-containing protein n=1 Tax=Methylovulum miyakonense TaxID=645578 RepID=UPI00036CA684|nr:PepSY domain-containing protein [Methylovulum miyakonense]
MATTKNKIFRSLMAIGLLAVTGATLSHAGEAKHDDGKNLQMFSQAKISLAEAIKAAEQKTGGKALEAELDDEAKTLQFEVEIVKDGKIHEVMVDGNTGQVLKAALDDEDESAEDEK